MMKQKLVMYQPSGPCLNSMRHSNLMKTGCPKFQAIVKSNTHQTVHSLEVPRDIILLWEKYKDDNSLSSLIIQLLGTQTLPDLSEYNDCKHLTAINFQGHIICIKAAIKIVQQFKFCEVVEFILGMPEQLPFFIPSSNSNDSDEIRPCKAVSFLKIVIPQKERDANMEEITFSQYKDVLEFSVIAFPELRKLTVDLPPEGKYFDLLKSYFPRWEHLKGRCFPEIRNNRTVVVEQISTSNQAVKHPHQKARPIQTQRRKSNDSNIVAHSEEKRPKKNLEPRIENPLKHSHTNERFSDSIQKRRPEPDRCSAAQNPSEADEYYARWNTENSAEDFQEDFLTCSSDSVYAHHNPFRNELEYDVKPSQPQIDLKVNRKIHKSTMPFEKIDSKRNQSAQQYTNPDPEAIPYRRHNNSPSPEKPPPVNNYPVDRRYHSPLPQTSPVNNYPGQNEFPYKNCRESNGQRCSIDTPANNLPTLKNHLPQETSLCVDASMDTTDEELDGWSEDDDDDDDCIPVAPDIFQQMYERRPSQCQPSSKQMQPHILKKEPIDIEEIVKVGEVDLALQRVQQAFGINIRK